MGLSEHIKLLGVSADEDVARLSGVSVAEIRAYREKRGVPAPRSRPTAMPRRPAAERESEVLALLRERGTLRKRDIEETLGWSQPTARSIGSITM